MNYKLFSIYDSKIEAYLPPVFMKSRGEFLRAFGEACRDPKSNFSRYPADFTAFELGSWDEFKCAFDLHKTPVSLGLAIEYADSKVEALKVV